MLWLLGKEKHVIIVWGLKKILFASKFTMKTIQTRQTGPPLKIYSRLSYQSVCRILKATKNEALLNVPLPGTNRRALGPKNGVMSLVHWRGYWSTIDYLFWWKVFFHEFCTESSELPSLGCQQSLFVRSSHNQAQKKIMCWLVRRAAANVTQRVSNSKCSEKRGGL